VKKNNEGREKKNISVVGKNNSHDNSFVGIGTDIDIVVVQFKR
jgi:hypothetical protein